MDMGWTDPVTLGGLSCAVAVVGENISHMPVLAGAKLQGQCASRLQTGLGRSAWPKTAIPGRRGSRAPGVYAVPAGRVTTAAVAEPISFPQ